MGISTGRSHARKVALVRFLLLVVIVIAAAAAAIRLTRWTTPSATDEDQGQARPLDYPPSLAMHVTGEEQAMPVTQDTADGNLSTTLRHCMALATPASSIASYRPLQRSQSHARSRCHGETLAEMEFLHGQRQQAAVSSQSVPLPRRLIDLTVIMPLLVEAASRSQLRAVRRQLAAICSQKAPYRPRELWIVYQTDEAGAAYADMPQAEATQRTPFHEELRTSESCMGVTIHHHKVEHVRKWLTTILDVRTSWLWVVTGSGGGTTLLPGERYVESTMRVVTLDKYANAVLGAYGMVLDVNNEDDSTSNAAATETKPILLPSVDSLIVADRLTEAQLLFGSWFGKAATFRSAVVHHLERGGDNGDTVALDILRELRLDDSFQFDIQMNDIFWRMPRVSRDAQEHPFLAVTPADPSDCTTWGDQFDNVVSAARDTSLRKIASPALHEYRRVFTTNGIYFEQPMDKLVAIVLYVGENVARATMDSFHSTCERYRSENHVVIEILLISSPSAVSTSCESVAAMFAIDPSRCYSRMGLLVFSNSDALRQSLRRLQPAIVIASDEVGLAQDDITEATVVSVHAAEWPYIAHFSTLDVRTLQSRNARKSVYCAPNFIVICRIPLIQTGMYPAFNST